MILFQHYSLQSRFVSLLNCNFNFFTNLNLNKCSIDVLMLPSLVSLVNYHEKASTFLGLF